MRKIILFAAILFASVSLVSAEGTPPAADPDAGTGTGTIKTGDINLTLNLNPFQSIEIGGTHDGGSGGTGSAGSNVVLNYVSADDYKNGVSTTMNDHITVVAAGQYAVYAEAKEANFTGHADDVATSTIKLSAEQGTTKGSTVSTFNDVPLSQTAAKLISSTTGTGTGNTFNVKYTGAGNNAYVDKLVDNKLTTYETTVTYTIAVE